MATVSPRIQRIYQSYWDAGAHNKILGIAKNYGARTPEWTPIWFDKPMSSLIFDGNALELPASFDKVVHEVELGVMVGKPGRNILARDAASHIAGFFVSLDFTNRGLGLQYKKDGAPWCLQKGS